MPHTKNKKICRHVVPMFAGAVLVVCSVVLTQTSSSPGQLSAMLQEESLNEIVQRTQQEYAAMRALPALPEDWEAHASAPAAQAEGLFAAVIDEIARWFGLQN
jgi:hypothetical protein